VNVVSTVFRPPVSAVARRVAPLLVVLVATLAAQAAGGDDAAISILSQWAAIPALAVLLRPVCLGRECALGVAGAAASATLTHAANAWCHLDVAGWEIAVLASATWIAIVGGRALRMRAGATFAYALIPAIAAWWRSTGGAALTHDVFGAIPSEVIYAYRAIVLVLFLAIGTCTVAIPASVVTAIGGRR
jgi:hypothetical protein